jgi:transposase-like protein
MRWPRHPVESVRPSRFHPPFCPWPECAAHRSPGRGFQRFGSYRRKNDPASIPRFRCRDCRRTCSRQTFSSTYYLKRPKLLVAVASGLAACSAHRQIARSNHCAKTSVTRIAERLGRHAMLFHARCLRSLTRLEEPIVHDHFETFVGRQDQALGVGTAVGSISRFVYDVDPAPHRGGGRRPDRPATRPVPAPGSRSYAVSIRRTLEALLALSPGPEPILCLVDGRADYPAALSSTAVASRVQLRIFPNPVRGPKGSPRSAEAIARDRAMAPVDQWHQLLRHSCADHKRETIAFGRRLESILGRAHLMTVWKNFLKARSERAPDRSTPAMRLALADAPWRWERVLARRLFSTRETPSESASRLYRKLWTPNLPALHLKHAG